MGAKCGCTKSKPDFTKTHDFGIVAVEAQTNGLYCILSDAVPSQVVISDKVVFLQLEKSIWVDMMISICKNNNLKIHENINIVKNDYDILEQAEKLEKIYCRLVNEI